MNPPTNQSEFVIIYEDSSGAIEIETDLSIDECIDRIQNVAASGIGFGGWDSIFSDVEPIKENKYHFYITFQTRRQKGAKITVGEANGIMSWDSDINKTLVSVQYSKIGSKSGKVLFTLLLSVVLVTLLLYLNGSSILDLLGFIMVILALCVFFLSWVDKASYSYRMQRLILNIFKAK